MIHQLVAGITLGVCIWGVLNPKLRTRTIGTLALSLIGLAAFVSLI
jgi:hypothetical protein